MLRSQRDGVAALISASFARCPANCDAGCVHVPLCVCVCVLWTRGLCDDNISFPLILVVASHSMCRPSIVCICGPFWLLSPAIWSGLYTVRSDLLICAQPVCSSPAVGHFITKANDCHPNYGPIRPVCRHIHGVRTLQPLACVRVSRLTHSNFSSLQFFRTKKNCGKTDWPMNAA